METNEDEANTKVQKKTPEEVKELRTPRALNEERRENDANDEDSEGTKNGRPSVMTRKSSVESSVKSIHSHPKASSSKMTPDAELEGEDQENLKEAEGPTFVRHKYDRTREDYEELSRSLRETATKTMIKMLELQATQRPQNQGTTFSTPNQQPNKLQNQLAAESMISTDLGGSMTGTDFEAQLKELDKNVKLTVSRIAESRREQAHLMTLINSLEVRMYRTEETEYIKEIMGKVPQEEDLEKMKQLQRVMMERKRLEREIQRLQMEIRVMNNAMANADVIISESAPIKKPRRVVIRTESDARQDCQNGARLTSNEYSSGKCEWPRNEPSPEQDLLEASGGVAQNEEAVEETKPSEDNGEEGEINESEVKASPHSTKGKKSKK